MENDLISRSALIAEHCAGCNSVAKGLCYYDVCGTAKLIMEAPTVDAVEVIRCEECKHRYYNEYNEMYCCEYWADGFDTAVCCGDFCSHGERRTENAAD